jgi:hypothetical protein
MFWCRLCLLCSMQSGIGEWLISKDTCFSEQRASNLFYGKVPHPLLWVGSRVARGKVSGVRRLLNYCGLRPRAGDPCSEHNYTLNRPFRTLQPSWAPLIMKCSFRGCVVSWAICIYPDAACECRKFPPVRDLPSLSVAQWAVRSPVNVSVKECNFTVL